MSKIYSVIVKNQRFDFTDADLESIKKGTTLTESGKMIVNLFTKQGRLTVTKAEFDAALEKSAKDIEEKK
jgi:hypothetical protein